MRPDVMDWCRLWRTKDLQILAMSVLPRRRRHAVPVTLAACSCGCKAQRVLVLQAPTDQEYQHAVLSLENRKAQCGKYFDGWLG